ncbi:ChaN family lipoprotein [Edwardsiella anguillarum]|nr:ChaN family lipoprotein [Edwardsiella anguillarum]
MRTMMLTLALLALSGCQTPAPVAERIVSLAEGQTLTPTQLVQRLAASPRVIVGERHDNPRHQQIARWLLLQMSAQRPQGSVLLEMLTPDQQAGVAAARQPSLSDAQVISLLQWSPGWPWAQYGPLVRSALRGGYPLLAANRGATRWRRSAVGHSRRRGRSVPRMRCRLRLAPRYAAPMRRWIAHS